MNADLRLALARADNAEKLLAEIQPFAEVGRFALNSRHEINNTLSSVIGNAELLLAEPDNFSPGVRDQIRAIHDMSVRIYEIVQRMAAVEDTVRRAASTSAGRSRPSQPLLKPGSHKKASNQSSSRPSQ